METINTKETEVKNYVCADVRSSIAMHDCVHAIRLSPDNREAVEVWCEGIGRFYPVSEPNSDETYALVISNNVFWPVTAHYGDWIVKSKRGMFYRMYDTAFRKLYELSD